MIINEGLPDTLINKPDGWLYKVELLLSIVFLTVHSTTIGVVTRITLCLPGVEWKIKRKFSPEYNNDFIFNFI